MFRWFITSELYNFRRFKLDKKISMVKCVYFCSIRPKSHYQVLGLDSTASPKEIKSAYYKLSLQFHPDKNNGCTEAVAKFREIAEAYEVLGNPEKKMKYDNSGKFQSSYSRPDYYYGRNLNRTNRYTGPYTGKTKDFDYDEHYKRHYQDYENRRQAEHEYFKRRWEAEFHRRYPNFEDYYRRPPTENYDPYETLSKNYSRRKHAYVIVVSIWVLIFLITSFNELCNPERIRRTGPLYYDVKKEKPEEKYDA